MTVELPHGRDLQHAARTLDLTICWLEDHGRGTARMRVAYRVLVDLYENRPPAGRLIDYDTGEILDPDQIVDR